jgi:two-component system sensor histidine kinase ChiS
MKNTILVVDDNPTNLRVLVDYLEEVGFEVLAAEDGETAIDLLQYTLPDIILLDVMMPGIDGFETCRRLKNDSTTKDIPVIFMTALSDTDDKVEGLQAGAVDYITKPLQHEEVLARIKTHLTINNLQKQLQAANSELELRVAERTAELAQANENLQKINMAYSRFVPKEFLNLLRQKDIIEVTLGDQIQMETTVLFADIRDFTTLSEKMTPQENFNFLNAYLGRLSPIIRKHNGFVDKYIGDAIMALFPLSADDALRAAIAMLNRLAEYNLTRQSEERTPIKIGIGIHTGRVMLGTVGETERMEGTVISDAVNLTARLEGLTKIYGASIITSGYTLSKLEYATQYEFRFLDNVQVKGKREKVSVFEVLDGEPERIKTLKIEKRKDFEMGVLYYHSQEFAKAKEHFEAVLEVNPEDEATMLYLRQVSNR